MTDRKPKRCACECGCTRYLRFDRYKSLEADQKVCFTCEVALKGATLAKRTFAEEYGKHWEIVK